MRAISRVGIVTVLPIEWKIEEQYRKKGRNKDEVPINRFPQRVPQVCARLGRYPARGIQASGHHGQLGDPYLTMDFHAERVIAEEFMKFLMNGTLYQGSKPVMWSPVEQTALAEAEVEYHDKDSFTIWVKFKVVGRMPILSGAQVVIWTTTPWTMPSNKAVVYGAGISYGLYEVTARPDECWADVGETFCVGRCAGGRCFGARPSWTRRCTPACAMSPNDDLAKMALSTRWQAAEGANG